MSITAPARLPASAPRSSRDIAREVTRMIIARLEAGTKPWTRPWSLTGEGGRPLRHEGTPYHGINCLWLWAIADARGYRSRYWMTARQAGELGGHVHRDAVPAMSIYASSFRKAGAPGLMGEKTSGALIRFLRHYWVYNADEVEGLPRYYYARDVPPTPALLSHRQAAIDAFFAPIPAELRWGGDRAYYDPGGDYIQLPHPGSFRSADLLASTRGHETAHWSGNETRLNRTFGKRFGDAAYCMEELCAELTSASICAELGLPSELHDSHASYLGHWIDVLRSDHSAIFTAASKAEQAFAYLAAFSRADCEDTAEPMRAAA
ncbi:zincin-like metallopeptidase domain-containing protein [Novosphingobium sp. ST904]|uniref:ArdC family protein n=2 Tax=Novosphingobium sp. ST904 TaxID=1684385 RepID=UPI0010525A21|nr:zincin-like metallopeptidase domain-containing protein [Novosphingobium sp. ST904]TCM32351.1 antirestriction protein ArdC [Novosphingobium sp. ST904]